MKLRIFRVNVLPSITISNSIYYVRDVDADIKRVDQYLTDLNNVLYKVQAADLPAEFIERINRLSDEAFDIIEGFEVVDGRLLFAGSAIRRTYQQPFTNQSTWSASHNLGYRPHATVLDDQGFEVLADVKHSDDNHLLVYFTRPLSGTLVLS